MQAKTLVKLSRLSRRYDRFEHPLRYRAVKQLLKRVYPRKNRSPLQLVAAYDQGLINIDTRILQEYDILFFGYAEPGIAGLIKTVVKPGDLCMDIGANIGALSLVMAHAAGPGGSVIAVEPHPRMGRRLQNNMALNRLETCRIIQAAVSDREQTTELYIAGESSPQQGKSSLRPSSGIPETVSIQTIRGRRLLEAIGDRGCSFVKIDVEGHDLIVLQELEELFRRHRPHIVFEYSRKRWKEHGCGLSRALRLLKGLDYSLYCLEHEVLIPARDPYPEGCDFVCVPKLNSDFVSA